MSISNRLRWADGGGAAALPVLGGAPQKRRSLWDRDCGGGGGFAVSAAVFAVSAAVFAFLTFDDEESVAKTA